MDPALIQELIKEGNHKMDLDKESVQVVAIVAASAVVVAAMIFDGAVGDAVGTVLLTGATAVVSYLAGARGGKKNADDEMLEMHIQD